MFLVTIHDGIEDVRGTVIHSPYISSLKATSAQIDLVGQGVSSFEFTINPENDGWNKIKPLRTLVKVKDVKKDKVVFNGRVLKPTQKMSSSGLFSITYICEDRMAYLNDSNQRFGEYRNMTISQFLQVILSNHNSQVESHKRFKLGVVTVTNNTDNVYRFLSYDKTLATIKDKLIDRLGGYIRIRDEFDGMYIDYLESVGTYKETAIHLRSNMKDMQKEIDPNNVITRLIPLGNTLEIRKGIVESVEGGTIVRVELQSDGSLIDVPVQYMPSGFTIGGEITIYGESPNWQIELGFSNETENGVSQPRLTISKINSGKDFLDDAGLIAEFGIIEGTLLFDDVAEIANLKLKGQQFLQSQKTARVTTDITPINVDLIDSSFDALEVDNWHRVINEVMAIDERVQIIGQKIDLNNPHLSSLTIGDKYLTLSQYQVEANKKMREVKALKEQVDRATIGNATLKADLKKANQDLQTIKDSLISVDIENLPVELQGIANQLTAIQQTVTDIEAGFDAIPVYAPVDSVTDGLMRSVDYMFLKSIVLATPLVDGLMSKEDKAKLDSIVLP